MTCTVAALLKSNRYTGVFVQNKHEEEDRVYIHTCTCMLVGDVV